MASPLNYRGAGVDLAAGDTASDILFRAAQTTWRNRDGRIGAIVSAASHFRTTRFARLDHLPPEACVGMNFDGIGTKIELAERLDTFETLAFDLMAMICDDAAVQGAEPVHVGSVIDTAKIDLHIMRKLAEGLIAAAGIANVAVINGEVAELPGRVSGFGESPFNWSGACFWVGRRDTILAWCTPQVGDALVGLAETGLRSNGFSLVRRILTRIGGEHWESVAEAAALGLFAARPSTIYSPFLLRVTGAPGGTPQAGVRCILHITGGGLAGRLEYAARTWNIGLDVEDPLPTPPEIGELCAAGNVTAADAYRTWNMGTGMVLVCDPEAIPAILSGAKRMGVHAKRIGTVRAEAAIRIRTFESETITTHVR